jgi:CDP-diacylglycerol pyrophosphatase
MTQKSPAPLLAAALLLGAICRAPDGAEAADPNTLWNIVHGKCVPERLRTGAPDPCAAVHIRHGVRRGYAVLKDIVGPAQYLLIPTSRISGIDSPAVLAPNGQNYFSHAWRQRRFVERRLHRALPPEDTSLAVNSAEGRSQNQLHIHIDCVRADVRDSLRRQQAGIGRQWKPLPARLLGHRYLAMRVEGDRLDANPFKLLASRLPHARTRMGKYSLVVVGEKSARHRSGFLILAARADAAGGAASGEELQDHACTVAREP